VSEIERRERKNYVERKKYEREREREREVRIFWPPNSLSLSLSRHLSLTLCGSVSDCLMTKKGKKEFKRENCDTTRHKIPPRGERGAQNARAKRERQRERKTERERERERETETERDNNRVCYYLSIEREREREKR